MRGLNSPLTGNGRIRAAPQHSRGRGLCALRNEQMCLVREIDVQSPMQYDFDAEMTRKEIKEQAARYAKFVDWSEADKFFVGQCPALFGGGVHGHDEAKVYAELCEAVAEWIELLHQDDVPLPEPEDGRKYSGKFVVRLEPVLHRRVAAKAHAAGESLNQYVARVLVKA